MELIVRTAHGTADVSIDVHDPDLSLRDLIAAITGQAAPTTALVDGQLTNAADTVATCNVVAGSVIDTLLDDTDQPVASTVTVVRQLSGPGAGRKVPLSAGRYRVGPGRRQHAKELSADVTDTLAFEIEVTPSSITLTPGPQSAPATTPVVLGGQPLNGPTAWRNESVVVGGRIFRLEPPSHRANAPVGSAVDGFVVHNRPPGITELDRTIAEAIDDARSRAASLWQRRSARGVISTDVGLVAHRGDAGTTGFEPVSLELGAANLLALVGQPNDRAGLARAIVVDVCTRYGPADVDVVIATTPGDLGDWDWAKWLPHIRWGSAVDLLTNDLEMARLGERNLARPTIVIVTADEIWNGPSSPLRSFVLNAPAHAAVIVLTDARRTAPASANTMVELNIERPGAGTLTRLDRNAAELELHVALLDVDTAADVARHLAPLVDPDRLTTSDEVKHTVTLDDVVRVVDAATTWDTARGGPGAPVEMAVGAVAGVTVGADFGLDASAVVSGSSISEAADVATVLALSMASTWSPTEASLLLIDHRAAHADRVLQQLPHHAGTFSARDAIAIERLLHRLRADPTREQPTSTRLVIVIMSIAETDLAAPGLVEGLVALAKESVGVHLVVATALPLAALDAQLRSTCQIEIAVDRYGGSRRATLHDRRRKLQTPFTPYDESRNTSEAISVRPFVFGRSPSALERRLERGAHARSSRPERAVDRIARHLAALAAERHIAPARPLVPVPLPNRILASDLWSAHSGDGVPQGLIDAPDAESAVAYWWQPGTDGSRVFVGSPRSGVRSALEVLLVGVVDRFATADIEVYVAEHNDRRRNSIAKIPHVVRAESPEHDGAVEAMLSDIADVMHVRRGTADFRVQNHPAILVIARDAERLSDPAAAALSHLLAEGADVGINVVAAAQRTEGIEGILRACEHIVVGGLTNPDDYDELGVERSPVVERNAGRAQLRDGTLVQLAELDAPLDNVLAALGDITENDR